MIALARLHLFTALKEAMDSVEEIPARMAPEEVPSLLGRMASEDTSVEVSTLTHANQPELNLQTVQLMDSSIRSLFRTVSFYLTDEASGPKIDREWGEADHHSQRHDHYGSNSSPVESASVLATQLSSTRRNRSLGNHRFEAKAGVCWDLPFRARLALLEFQWL
ncbi:hypothetical protein NDU88_006994 [Pleurodeles waltl]|uniref:Uncharacterized protein n=1 Tax=Pleurodeles waltl TaxID=8319 RepID=A0AAV7UPE8_PLEWA|nr:hypothetical protein NDU88_006994 [Pleurodeles waltl]